MKSVSLQAKPWTSMRANPASGRPDDWPSIRRREVIRLQFRIAPVCPLRQYLREALMMQDWTGSSRVAAAEDAYVAAEMERLQLICNRSRMDKDEYLRALGTAWFTSVDALEILTSLRNAEAAERLREAAEKLEAA